MADLGSLFKKYSFSIEVRKFLEEVLESTSGGSGATQLIELTDVSGASASNGNVLIANGTSFFSRPLVTTDISDFPGTVTFGSENEIPTVNSTTNGFDYSSGFSYDGTRLIAGSGTNVLIGVGATGATESSSVGIGTSTTTGEEGVAVGGLAQSNNGGATSLGWSARALGNGSLSLGRLAGNTTGTHGGLAISIGAQANQGTLNIGANSIAIGSGTETSATGAISIGSFSQATAQGAVLMGYHSSSQVNNVSDSFKLMWDGNIGFWTGLTIGTAVTSSSDPDTLMTDAVNGAIAYDTTDHEFRAYVNGAWTTLGSGGGGASQLSDLSDVVSATNTNRFVLAANGTTGYVGRLLVEADISDLGSYAAASHTHTTSDITDLSSYTGFDARYYTESEVDALTWNANDITAGTFADARIAESNVTQHQAALSIGQSQITQNIQTVSTTNPGTVTPTTANDVVELTNLQNAVTINNPTGSPSNYDSFFLTIDANGAYAITWGGDYDGNGYTLPATTPSDRTLTLSVFYSSDLAKWVVSASNELAVADLTDGSLVLKSDTTATLSVGYAASVYDGGTQSTGTYTPDESNGQKQRLINGGAFTLAPPTNYTNVEVLITNNGSAGAITTSGFTQVVGDSFDTTNTNQFLCNISTTFDGTSTISVLNVIALQ